MERRPGRPTGEDEWLPAGTKLPPAAPRRRQAATPPSAAPETWLPSSEKLPPRRTPAPVRLVRMPELVPQPAPVPAPSPQRRQDEIDALQHQAELTLDRIDAGRLAINEAVEAATRAAQAAGTAAARSETAERRSEVNSEEIGRLRSDLAAQSERISRQQQLIERLARAARQALSRD